MMICTHLQLLDVSSSHRFLIKSSPSLSEFVSTGAIARSRAYFGRGTGAILLDQVACTGTETRLVNCRSNPLGIHDCSHSEDAGVTCQGMYVSLHCLYTLNMEIGLAGLMNNMPT